MKEAYFTPETIKPQAEKMLHTVRSERERRPDQAFRVEQAALLVLDMQNYFLDPRSHAFIPSAPAVLPHIAALTAAFHRSRRPVVFTRHHNIPGRDGMMESWWHDLIQPGTPPSQIIPDLNLAGSCLLDKSHYDAFYETGLEAYLRQRSTAQVVITGVMTHLCCETTARSAFMRGFQVFFTVDATASYRQDYHKASLLNLSHGFAVPVLAAEIEAACG
jgi:nicotinamidase-related amidase